MSGSLAGASSAIAEAARATAMQMAARIPAACGNRFRRARPWRRESAIHIFGGSEIAAVVPGLHSTIQTFYLIPARVPAWIQDSATLTGHVGSSPTFGNSTYGDSR